MKTIRKDSVLLFIPALIGVIIIVSVVLLDIQLANFQEAYFREVAEETRRNNNFLVRFFLLLQNILILVLGLNPSIPVFLKILF